MKFVFEALRDFIRYLWKRDSDSAQIVCINVMYDMDDRGLRDMAQCFEAVLEQRRSRKHD